MSIKQTYFGVGKVYLRVKGAAAPLLFVGNVSQLDLAPETAEQSVQDFTALGGGKYDSVRRISGVGITMTQWDLSGDNLQRALRGTNTREASAAVADEPHTAYIGGLVALSRIPDLTDAVTVTGTGGTPTYVVDEDYQLTPAGIIILEGGAITDALAIEVSYTARETDVVQALTQADQSYELLFEGLNEAESGNPVIVRVHRAKFGALQSLPLIGENFASVTVEGDALADTAITGAGLSRYFTVERATPAA